MFTEKQAECRFSSFPCRIRWVSWLVKLEGELDTAVFLPSLLSRFLQQLHQEWVRYTFLIRCQIWSLV